MNNPRRISGGSDILVLKSELIEYLKQENKKHVKRALNTGQKSCQQCGFCCLRQPCVPTPVEFSAVASYLGITPQELATQYSVVNTDKGALYLLWARETQTDLLGKALPYYRTYDRGYCIFFDKKTHGCMIHPIRPRSAKDTKCWLKKTKECKATWSIDQIKAVIPDFDPYIAALEILGDLDIRSFVSDTAFFTI